MINKITAFTTNLFLFLLPLFFIPIGNTSIQADKQVLLVFFSFLLFFLFLLKSTTEKKITIVKTPIDIFVFLLAILSILSTFFVSPNKIHSLTTPMGAGTILAATLLFFSLTHYSYQIPNTKYQIPLILSSSIVSLLVLLQQLSTLNSQLSTLNLSPLGGLLPTFLFLTAVMVLLGSDLALALGRKVKIISRGIILRLLALFLITPAVFLSGFHLATDQKPLLLPFSFGWAIMMEMYKNISNFFLGVGPANFSFAYTLGKPVGLNLTSFWNTIVFTSTNLPITLATEIGAFAGIIFLFLIIKILNLSSFTLPSFTKSTVPISPTSIKISLLTTLFLQLLFPSNVVLFTLSFILLAFALPKKEIRQLTLRQGSGQATSNQQLTIYLASLSAFLLLFVFFFQGKIYLGDVSYRKALSALSSQNFQEAYNQSRKAVSLNQFSERNLNLASSLSLEAARSLSAGENATTSARQISFFSQQAINYAQQAISLNPQNSQSYAQLANVYQAMIGATPGAEQLALDALNTQMRLDPNSPQPKLAAARLLISAGQFDQAQLLLLQAINLKPDWNSTHYNLANLYTQVKNYRAAAAELQRTLNLTPVDSEDYKRIEKELEQIKTLLPQEATPSASPAANRSQQAPSISPTLNNTKALEPSPPNQ